jgi:hypothetical protein
LLPAGTHLRHDLDGEVHVADAVNLGFQHAPEENYLSHLGEEDRPAINEVHAPLADRRRNDGAIEAARLLIEKLPAWTSATSAA